MQREESLAERDPRHLRATAASGRQLLADVAERLRDQLLGLRVEHAAADRGDRDRALRPGRSTSTASCRRRHRRDRRRPSCRPRCRTRRRTSSCRSAASRRPAGARPSILNLPRTGPTPTFTIASKCVGSCTVTSTTSGKQRPTFSGSVTNAQTVSRPAGIFSSPLYCRFTWPSRLPRRGSRATPCRA